MQGDGRKSNALSPPPASRILHPRYLCPLLDPQGAFDTTRDLLDVRMCQQ
jgi:hypothetical protein